MWPHSRFKQRWAGLMGGVCSVWSWGLRCAWRPGGIAGGLACPASVSGPKLLLWGAQDGLTSASSDGCWVLSPSHPGCFPPRPHWDRPAGGTRPPPAEALSVGLVRRRWRSVCGWPGVLAAPGSSEPGPSPPNPGPHGAGSGPDSLLHGCSCPEAFSFH